VGSHAHEFRACIDAGCVVEDRAADPRVYDLAVVQVEIDKGGSEKQAETGEGDDDDAPDETAIPSGKKTMVDAGLRAGSSRHCS